jgi:hypothetical protein
MQKFVEHRHNIAFEVVTAQELVERLSSEGLTFVETQESIVSREFCNSANDSR